MIIGVSGKIGSGKDTVGTIIQYLVSKLLVESGSLRHLDMEPKDTKKWNVDNFINCSTWSIKKFAGKLKECVSIITGIPRADLEKIDVKNSSLGEEWNRAQRLEDMYGVKYQSNKLVPLTVRQLLQEFGTDACRQVIHPNFWVNALFSEYRPINTTERYNYLAPKYPTSSFTGATIPPEVYPNWIITDMRFPNELKAVEDRKGITIRVDRLQFKEQNGIKYIPLPFEQHPSETALDDAHFDYIIDNNSSIDNLILTVKNILIERKILMP